MSVSQLHVSDDQFVETESTEKRIDNGLAICQWKHGYQHSHHKQHQQWTNYRHPARHGQISSLNQLSHPSDISSANGPTSHLITCKSPFPFFCFAILWECHFMFWYFANAICQNDYETQHLAINDNYATEMFSLLRSIVPLRAEIRFRSKM